jgi:hypothetical protein
MGGRFLFISSCLFCVSDLLSEGRVPKIDGTRPFHLHKHERFVVDLAAPLAQFRAVAEDLNV